MLIVVMIFVSCCRRHRPSLRGFSPPGLFGLWTLPNSSAILPTAGPGVYNLPDTVARGMRGGALAFAFLASRSV